MMCNKCQSSAVFDLVETDNSGAKYRITKCLVCSKDQNLAVNKPKGVKECSYPGCLNGSTRDVGGQALCGSPHYDTRKEKYVTLKRNKDWASGALVAPMDFLR